MTTLAATQRRSRRQPLAALGRLTIMALVGIVLTVAYIVGAVNEAFEAVDILVLALPLLIAALMWTGWRWTPALAGVIGGLLSVVLIGSLPYLIGQRDSPVFVPLLILMGFGVVACIGGIGATVQNYRRPASDRPLPRWTPYGLTALAAFLAGAIVIAVAPQPAVEDGIDPAALAGVPALGARDYAYTEPVLRVRAGETVTLRLSNDDPDMHFFDLDDFNVHAPMPAGRTGIAIFRPTEPGTYTFYCAPHFNKATGQGMKGTLIVAP
jgi:plastocyanin